MSLTIKRNGKNAIPLLNAVCGINLPYWRIDRADDLHSYLSGDAADKLAAFEEAEDQGRLVILPVKAGDTVYQLRDKKHALGVGVHPRHISCVCVYGNDWIAMHQGDKPCAKKDLGKTWFLTREEAEAALKDGDKE